MISARVHAPAPLTAAVVDEKSVTIVELASAVPAKEMVVVANTAKLLGEVRIGAPGAVVSSGGLGVDGTVAGVD